MAWSDIAAWIKLNNLKLTAFEVELLKGMDCAYIEAINKAISNRTQ